MGSDAPHITVGAVDGGLYIGLPGCATQRACAAANRVVADYLATNPQQPSIVLDLDGCDWIDSTFAGWMISLRRRLGRPGGARLRLAHCADRCRASLDHMNLGALFEFIEPPTVAAVRTIQCPPAGQPDRETLQLMLQAHEELATINEENANVFRPIVAMLRKQLEPA